MKPAITSRFFHPVFIMSLFVLLANDFWWKAAYPNWLTGKLSDVAGMVVLPVFCFALFAKAEKKKILLACAVFFWWWKSPLSQPLISFINEQLQLPVQRVVDYSDLLALLVLPFTLFIRPLALSSHPIVVRSLQWTLGFFTLFSLCSTSIAYRNLFQAHPDMDDIFFHESFTLKQPAVSVLQTLQAKEILYKTDSVMYYPVTNQNKLYYRLPGTDSANRWQPISQAKDSTLYVKWEGKPYYLIPLYRTGTRTFRKIRFTLSENKKKTKTVVTVETFLSDEMGKYSVMNETQRKLHKNLFKNLFSPKQ